MRPLAVAAATLIALVGSGCDGGEDVPPLPEGRFVTASQSIAPDVALFAEPVVARVDVIVDRDRFDPAFVRVAGKFEPYEQDGEIVRTRNDQGRYTHLRYEFTLRCLVYDCLQEIGGGPPEVQPGGLPPPHYSGGFGERKTVALAPARVLYDDPEGETQVLRSVPWPPVQSVSRLNFGDTDVTGIGFPFEASVIPLPTLSYPISPPVLAAGLLLGALALLALPAVLVTRSLRREPPAAPTEPELSALEKALLLVEWARGRSDAERREALEALAVELDVEESALASHARKLAWSRARPAPEAADELVRSVRESGGTSD